MASRIIQLLLKNPQNRRLFGLTHFSKSTSLIRHFSNNINTGSYYHSTSSKPLLGITLSQVLDKTVEKFPDEEAVVSCHQNIRKNYFQFRKDVDNVAIGLLALNLKKGDRIGIWSPNCYEWVLTQYAAARIGLILVCLNAYNLAREQEHCIGLSGLRVLISAESCKETKYYPILEELVPEIANGAEIIRSKRFPKLERIIMISDKKLTGTLNFDSIIGAGGSKERSDFEHWNKSIQIHDPACISFTSGTTGLSKGAVVSNHNVVNMAHVFAIRLELDDAIRKKICSCSPLFHAMGVMLCSVTAIVSGHCLVLPAPMFSTSMTMEALHKERCNVVVATPTMYIDILNHPDFDKYDFSSIEKAISGGAPVPSVMIQSWQNKIKSGKLLAGYGCTECTAATSINTTNDDSTVIETTVGKPLAHLEVKVVDEIGNLVEWNAPGEILVRGHSTMLGFWEDKDKTKQVFTSDHWFKTGDIGSLDQNGYVKIIGRMSDLIIRGGSNIYPKEVEDFLLTNPKIVEVYVFGVPDKRLGEQVCAWILLKSDQVMTEDEVKSFCKNKIASYKIPTFVKFVQEFPKLGTGKVAKRLMREKMIEEITIPPH